MKFEDFVIIQEAKSYNDATAEFWIDDLGNMKVDIDDKEDIMAYIKKRADKLGKQYSQKADGRSIGDLTKDEIIKKLGWALVNLSGRKVLDSVKCKGKDKPIPHVIYKRAIITHPFIHSTKKNGDESISDILKKLLSMHSSIDEIISMDKNGTVKHFTLKNKDTEWKPKKIQMTTSL